MEQMAALAMLNDGILFASYDLLDPYTLFVPLQRLEAVLGKGKHTPKVDQYLWDENKKLAYSLRGVL